MINKIVREKNTLTVKGTCVTAALEPVSVDVELETVAPSGQKAGSDWPCCSIKTLLFRLVSQVQPSLFTLTRPKVPGGQHSTMSRMIARGDWHSSYPVAQHTSLHKMFSP